MDRKRSRSPDRRNFKPSGILNKYENRKNGEVALYSEPLDGKMPLELWKLFQFTGEESKTIDIYNKSYYLIGKDINADIHLNNPSISKQHAVIQFKQRKKEVIPYIIDLNSKHGCYLNGEKIDNSRFYQLKNKDLLNFGLFEDDFVVMNYNKKINLTPGC
jgi:smad nuclear-interacting protein 1